MIMKHEIVCKDNQVSLIKQEVKALNDHFITVSSRQSVSYGYKVVTIRIRDGELMDRVRAEHVLRNYIPGLRVRVFEGALTEAQTVKQNGQY